MGREVFRKGEIIASAVYLKDPYGNDEVDWRLAVYSKPSSDGGHWVFELPTGFHAMESGAPIVRNAEDRRPAGEFWPWLEGAHLEFGFKEE